MWVSHKLFAFTIIGLTAASILLGPGKSKAQDIQPNANPGVAAPAPAVTTADLAPIISPDLLTNQAGAGAQGSQSAGGGGSGRYAVGYPPAVINPVPPYAAERWPWIVDLPYRPIPPLGNAPVLPTGPGYYSLRDLVTGNYRQSPPQTPYPPYALMRNSFFDADFRYLDDPDYVSEDFFDQFHNVHLGDDWLFGTGGEADWRHMHQVNSRLSGSLDDYDLLRERAYVDLWYRDIFRIYVEELSSTSVNQDLKPLKTDIDHFDFLNAFIDLNIGWLDDHPVYLRGGRQELLIGSERLVTPLEWANTRQTFQGVHALWSNSTWDADIFWVQPVIPEYSGFSSIDDKQNFYGAYFTYHPNKTSLVDMYCLYLDNENSTTTLGIEQAPTRVVTLGTRYTGDENGFLWDFEPIGQVGDVGSRNLDAAAVSAGLGWNFSDAPLNPTFWIYDDFASGSDHPNTGTDTTFNQLYGFGHYYLGFMDLIGRQNINDLNAQVYLYPVKWVNFNVQYHVLTLDSARDALYGAAGTPLRVSATGSAGKDVGEELSFIVNFHLGPHSDILVTYSKLYEGNYIRETATTGSPLSPEMFSLMYNIRW